jgi:hypothetical protein
MLSKARSIAESIVGTEEAHRIFQEYPELLMGKAIHRLAD